MNLSIKGQFLKIGTRVNKETNKITHYVKVLSGDDMANIKLSDDWKSTPLSKLKDCKMGEPVEIDVELNLFNDKVYFKTI